MFNSPLHYCKVCKQYVALDQPAEECAREQGCNAQACRSADLFCQPTPSQEGKDAKEGSVNEMPQLASTTPSSEIRTVILPLER